MEQNQNLSQWDTVSIDKNIEDINNTEKPKANFLLIAIIVLFVIVLGGTITLYVIFFIEKRKDKINDENNNQNNTQTYFTKTTDVNDQTEEIELYNTLSYAIANKDKEKLLETMLDSNNEIQDSFELDEAMTWELLEGLTTDYETLSTEMIEQFWKDQKQTIITINNTDSSRTFFYVRDKEGNAKILKFRTNYSEDIPIDTDQDGRYDDDETCLAVEYEYLPENCIETDQ